MCVPHVAAAAASCRGSDPHLHGRTQDALTPFVARWDGNVWTHVPTPFEKFRNLPLYSVSADSPGDIWAVGHHVIVRYSC
jgi:hypothetical protein